MLTKLFLTANNILGREYSVIRDLLRDVKFCQILIEVHGVNRRAHNEVELLKVFAQNDYYMFSYEINGLYLPLCEFSFIHKSCMHEYGVKIMLGRIF